MHLISLFAFAGALAGAAGRWLLAKLRRGTSVHIGWCAGGLAVLWGILGWRVASGHLPWWWLPIPVALTWFAVLLTATDLKHRRLPNALTLPAYPVIAAATLIAATRGGGWPLAVSALTGAVALGFLYAAIHLASPRSLGAGDVKLSGTQGAVLGAVGWPAVLLGTALAAVLTLLLKALTPSRLTSNWQPGIPHGPGLLAATSLIATFPGPP